MIHKLIFLKGKCGRKGRKETHPFHPFLSSSHYLLQTRGFPYIKQYAQVIQYTGVGFAAAYLNHSTSPPFSVSHFTLLSFIMNPIQRHHYHHHHHYLITTFSPPSNLTNHHSLQMTNIPYPLPSTSRSIHQPTHVISSFLSPNHPLPQEFTKPAPIHIPFPFPDL